jgi:hypothetical protein
LNGIRVLDIPFGFFFFNFFFSIIHVG